MSETSALSNTNPNSSSCWTKAVEPKWTDAALITGFVALLIIAIAASTGAFNAIGTTNTAYLSYGMYAGAAIFLIAEIVKVAVNCFKRTHNDEGNNAGSTKKTSKSINFKLDEDLNAQITKIIISGMCGQSFPCQHNNCTIIFADGQSIETDLGGYDARALTLAIDRNKFVYDNSDTKHNPVDHFKDYHVADWGNLTARHVLAGILGK